jgi:hypothetical protein
MHPPTRTLPALVGVLICGLAASLSPGIAQAAPITVNVRVEGATKTLFEGPVGVEALEAPGIEAKSSGGAHPCDVKDNGSNGGFGAAGAAPIGALYDAAVAQGLPFDATWSGEFNDFLVEQFGEDVANANNNGAYWGYAVNFTTAEVGGCQIRLAPGSEVLWAYNFFGLPHLSKLSGPASVNAGTPFTVHVSDGQTGQPIAGAAVGLLTGGVTQTSASSPTTNASGDATVTLTQAGSVTLKAAQSESVRSNGLTICVHQGEDGTCGTTIPAKELPHTLPAIVPGPNVVHADGIRGGHTYSRHSAPRLLSGSVDVPAGGTLSEVSVSLERSRHGHCAVFSGSREAFVRAKCHTQRFFRVARTSSFSYLLPARLPAGRYVYVIRATGAPAKPVSVRVAFRVK